MTATTNKHSPKSPSLQFLATNTTRPNSKTNPTNPINPQIHCLREKRERLAAMSDGSWVEREKEREFVREQNKANKIAFETVRLAVMGASY